MLSACKCLFLHSIVAAPATWLLVSCCAAHLYHRLSLFSALCCTARSYHWSVCACIGTWCHDQSNVQGQHGQNLVFSNALYQGVPANDIWTANCMHPDVSHRGFGTDAADKAAPGDGMDFPSIAIAASPDSWSFQHFQDRVTHIILQGKHLTNTDTTYITGKEPASTVVSALWEKLVPGSKKRVLHTSAQRWPRSYGAAVQLSCTPHTPLVCSQASRRSGSCKVAEAFG